MNVKVLSWSDFKSLVFTSLKLPVRYIYTTQGSGEEKAEQYQIFAGEEGFTYECYLDESTATDFNDFVNNYKSICNRPVHDDIGRQLVTDTPSDTVWQFNSITTTAEDYETNKTTFMGDNFEMIYFTEIEGRIELLNEDQIMMLKNDWVILNPDTYRRTAPYDMSEAGFYVPKNKAKKRGIPGVNSKSIVLEVKIKPEYIDAFNRAITISRTSIICQGWY